MRKLLSIAGSALLCLSACQQLDESAGATSISKWYENKKGAVSLTFDDGTIHQFTVAMPMLDSLDIRGTFYIVTGKIPGSTYRGTFLGRAGEEIIAETARQPTDSINLFERASAIGFLGYEGGLDYHTRAGAAVDAGRLERAIEIIEEGYAKIRSGALKRRGPLLSYIEGNDTTTWDQYREYAARGHEIGSHTVTHPRLAILDEENLLYELRSSREEIKDQLGADYIFTVECPYGTENERVMAYAYKEYTALRNRMPEPYLHELNRWDTLTPGETSKEYVQWQRGPLSKTPMDLMKSWVDTVANHDNAWLVLVFHGVEGVGWEPKSKEELRAYFSYIASKKEELWIAPFVSVTQYMRERMAAKLDKTVEGNAIILTLSHGLDPSWYVHPLTLKTQLPEAWEEVKIEQEGKNLNYQLISENGSKMVMFNAAPNGAQIRISKAG